MEPNDPGAEAAAASAEAKAGAEAKADGEGSWFFFTPLSYGNNGCLLLSVTEITVGV